MMTGCTVPRMRAAPRGTVGLSLDVHLPEVQDCGVTPGAQRIDPREDAHLVRRDVAPLG
jgi:hypothetical protein